MREGQKGTETQGVTVKNDRTPSPSWSSKCPLCSTNTHTYPHEHTHIHTAKHTKASDLMCRHPIPPITTHPIAS